MIELYNQERYFFKKLGLEGEFNASLEWLISIHQSKKFSAEVRHEQQNLYVSIKKLYMRISVSNFSLGLLQVENKISIKRAFKTWQKMFSGPQKTP